MMNESMRAHATASVEKDLLASLSGEPNACGCRWPARVQQIGEPRTITSEDFTGMTMVRSSVMTECTSCGHREVKRAMAYVEAEAS